MHGLEDLIREHRAFVRASLAQFGVYGVGIDDAEQEVFLVLLRRSDAFDPASSYRRWLWGISRNVAHAWRRRERRPAIASPAWEPCSFEDRVHVDEAMGILDDHQRRVWLARVEGHTAQEIASEMRVPLTTVQWRIRTAKERLQAFVAEAGRRCRVFVVFVRGSVPNFGCTIAGLVMFGVTVLASSQPRDADPWVPVRTASRSEPLATPMSGAVVPYAAASPAHAPHGYVHDDVIEIIDVPELRVPPRRVRARGSSRSRAPDGTVTPLDPHVLRLPPASVTPKR